MTNFIQNFSNDERQLRESDGYMECGLSPWGQSNPNTGDVGMLPSVFVKFEQPFPSLTI